MARLAPLPHPAEPAAPLDRPIMADRGDVLAGDRIDFDAWLLPPETPDRAERAIRFCSAAAGPVAFAAALVWFVGRIV